MTTMNLTIDRGNSFTKLVLFDNKRIIKRSTFRNFSIREIKVILQQYPVNASILSSVVKTPVNILKFLRQHTYFIEFNAATKLPVRNLYRTPQTLGKDRLASVIGASDLFPGENVLVIDAGTCIKYDLVNKKKEYRGGSISPGLLMRFQSLHEFTEKLPLVKPDAIHGFIGRDTRESILSGVQQGIINEMNGFIRLYRKKFPDLKILLTGGDAKHFARPLKLHIFAASDLVNIGLNTILLHHVAKNKDH